MTEKVVEAINSQSPQALIKTSSLLDEQNDENELDHLSGRINDVSSSQDDNDDTGRVYVQLGEILKSRLEADYEAIVKQKKVHNLPSKLPVIAILENFVRYYALKQICGIQEEEKPKRKYSHPKYEKYEKSENQREKAIQSIISEIELCKEVADGLRIYFDFTIKDYLLYSQEIKQAEFYLSPEYFKTFKYIVPENV